MTFLVKPVTGARARALIERGDSWLSGYVFRGQDVATGAPISTLFQEWGLGFPGSPFSPDAPTMDILRIPVAGTVQLATPGGDKPQDLPPFADHSPLSGTGLVETASGVVPYWWMQPSPVPPGSTMWRIYADGSEEHLATYGHVALGWLGPTPAQQLAPTPIRFPEIIGTWATINGERLLADALPDGSVVICSPAERSEMQQSARGVWWTTVPRDQVDSLEVVRLHGTWRDRHIQVVGMEGAEGGPIAHLVYTGHDAHDAESLGLAKTDAGVYEGVVPVSELSDLAEARTVLQ